MVRFVEPPYGGSSTDVFLFTSMQAIFSTFTKEQIGCGVKRLWNIGLAKGNAYKSKNCTITKEPFMRMKRKSAPTTGEKTGLPQIVKVNEMGQCLRVVN